MASSVQATYVLFRDDDVLKLPYCIVLSGFICALFAFGIPYLSALRIWLGFSTVFSLIYIVIAFVLSLRDGIILLVLFSAALPTFMAPYAFLFVVIICSVFNMTFRFTTDFFEGITAPARDYSIPDSHSTKVFTTIGAVASLVFAYNTGMLPEIQVSQCSTYD